MAQVDNEEHTWALIAWVIPLVGGILGLVMKPNSNYVKHWSYLSISFGLFIIVVEVVLGIISIPFIFIPILHLIISVVLGTLIGLGFLVVWIIGILRERSALYWKPAIIYDIARMMGAQ
ncbi:hypothetical protein GCM10007981_14520 [Thermocladium modestius]|uniref:DUF4870 domain-containing protein n=1 Tax=Thermocladium modestius TaxID=62609 RepID=A0A830GUQ6_9CREN|nr:hypothetical protein [Thermocladium modestius]GGP21690.1 hypothetical protein GCM10007981_14520 [Thermocladium modestius]